MIRRGEHPIPEGIYEVDFWVVNEAHVIVTNHGGYDKGLEVVAHHVMAVIGA